MATPLAYLLYYYCFESMLKFPFTLVNKNREDTRSLFMLLCLCGLVPYFVKNCLNVGISCRINQVLFFNTTLSVLIENIL